MSDEDFPFDGVQLPLSTPDEDAWEAYLTSALEQLGADGSTGMTNKKLAELESCLGVQLPFEIGLLLVMGVPDTDGWRHWNQNPTKQIEEWDNWVADGIVFDVEHNGFWLTPWGIRPDDADSRRGVVTSVLESAPRLLPLYGHRAIPLSTARGEEATESNPVLSVYQTDVIVYGNDLADWLNKEFDVPLPMWTDTPDRWFPVWSELAEKNAT